MKMAIAMTLLTTLAPLVILGQTTGSGAGKDTPAEEEIRRLNVEEVEAFLHHDVKALADLWSDDFVVTNPFNKFVTKAQVLGMVESGTLAFTSYKRNVEYIHIYDETAVVAGSESVVWAGKLPVAGKSNDLRFTTVWIKQKGRWQEVARHANIIAQP